MFEQISCVSRIFRKRMRVFDLLDDLSETARNSTTHVDRHEDIPVDSFLELNCCKHVV